MGIIHYVGCQQCQVYRNLDKLYIPVIRNRQDVIAATGEFVSGEKSAGMSGPTLYQPALS